MSSLKFPLVCIDTETTGLKVGYHEIFEIAMVRVDENFNLTNEYLHEFITIEHPERFDLTAQRITGKRPEDLLNKTPKDVVRKKIIDWILDISIHKRIQPFGQNYSFDKRMIKYFLGNDFYNRSFYDIYFDKEQIDLRWKAREFKAWMNEINRVRFEKEGRVYKNLKNEKLETVAELCKVINTEAHTALSDVKTTVECYKKLTTLMERGL